MTPPVRRRWQDSRIARLRRFVVVSPHLDDAALSLGASIARATRGGAQVTVVTILGGDPASGQAAGQWDRQCGFTSAREAVEERRREEAQACRVLGARSVPLPFADEQYRTAHDPVAIWAALEPMLLGAEAVLLPGWPLLQSDHRWISQTALERLPRDVPVGLYVDQPYAVWEAAGPPELRSRITRRLQQAARSGSAVRRQSPRVADQLTERWGGACWEVGSLGIADQATKLRAMRCYHSQLRGFGSLFLSQLLLYAWADGGEPIGWTD